MPSVPLDVGRGLQVQGLGVTLGQGKGEWRRGIVLAGSHEGPQQNSEVNDDTYRPSRYSRHPNNAYGRDPKKSMHYRGYAVTDM